MPTVRWNGADLFWEKTGSGPALILGAGLGGSATWWTPNLPELSKDFTVYTFDQRGTGRSSKVPVESVEQLSADLVAIMDDAGLASAHYVGHSTGGAIGVATAIDAPGRLSSLIVYASTTSGDDYRRKVLGLRRQIFEHIGVDAYAAYSTLLLYPPSWINEHPEEVAAEEARAAAQLANVEIHATRLAAILKFDRRADLHRVNIPTLVVCAVDDILTPKYFSEEYERLIPDARSVWVDWGGHALSRTRPEYFNRAVIDFVSRIRRGE
jgi:aminoacrylate hydrolase